jgi:integrase
MPKQNKGFRLEKNKFGVYEVRWCEAGRSKRASTGCRDFSLAQDFMGRFILRRNATEAERKNPSIATILTDYRKEHVEEHVMDKVRADNCITRLLVGFGSLRPEQVTNETVSSYKAARRVQLAGDSTISRELVVLVAALNHARKNRRVSADAIPFIQKPPATPPRSFALTAKEAQQLRRSAAGFSPFGHSRISLFVEIALATGARRRSIETLTWQQVDFEQGVINFGGDGLKQKNKRRGLVPMNSILLQRLRIAKCYSINEFVLGSDKSIQGEFDKLKTYAADWCENPRFLELTIHDLRRTWATLAAQSGVSIYDIAGVLGDSVATVEKHYAKHCPQHLRKAVELMT